MANISKRKQHISQQIDPDKSYSTEQAVELLKQLSTVKFEESVEVAISLSVDPRKSDQVVRGSIELPHGTGKTTRVAVFAQGQQAEEALQAGADKVGWQDLSEDIEKGEINYDVVIAAPEAMSMVGKLGPILGPKGLMPNPKVGTVAADVAAAVRSFKAGKIQYRTDRGGNIHAPVGKLNFETAALSENLDTLVLDLKRHKPASSKGIYLKKVVLSSTMGPGLFLEPKWS